MATASHRWHFFRAGGVDQVALRDAADIVHLPDLDPKLWAALAMPTRGLELDPRTLDLLDTDKDGRIRLPEVLAAIKLVEAGLVDVGAVMKGGETLPLDAIKDAKIQAAAKRALAELGRPEQPSIALKDLTEHAGIVEKLKINGDGVLPPETAEDPETEKVIRDILDTVGGVADKSGEKGVDQASVDKFFGEAEAYVAWYGEGEAKKELLPLGEATAAAASALAAVRAKVDDYFTRTRLAAFDPRAQAAVNGAEADLAAIAAAELGPTSPEVAKLPLARVERARSLPLADGINPAWSGRIATFAASSVTPLVGNRDKLDENDWAAVQKGLAPHEAWSATKPASSVDKLGVARLRQILAGESRAKLGALIAKDAAQDALNKEVVDVERLLRYKRDLLEILNNFANFSRFYRRQGAVFQAGTLYFDGRSCELCIYVEDAGKHAALAAMADAYLAYCDLTRPSGEKKSVVAAVTGGDADNLFVGRNGVFYDRKNVDWDATITKIVANPISVRQAFWAPYKKFARLIEEQVQKRAQAADAESQSMLTKAATAAANADKEKEAGPAPPKDAPPPEKKKIDVGTVAAIGVAVGGIGAMVVGLMTSFFGLGIWMPVGVLVLLLLISGPSMLLAWLKLRRRNLGPLLDANGWAINGRARINVPFGGALTRLATLPRGAQRSLDDPFAEKRRPWTLYFVVLIILVLGVSWYVGKLDNYLPKAVRSTEVLGDNAPAASKPAPPPEPKK